MAATLQFQDDTQSPITQWPFGIIDGNHNQQYKFYVKNVGIDVASNVVLKLTAVGNGDGADYVQFAPDNSGNPGSYTASDIAVGTLAAGASYAFWVKVTIPSNASANGNPRYFNVGADYTGI